jgi:hypothetical protein
MYHCHLTHDTLKKQVPSRPFPVSQILYCDLLLCHRLLPSNLVILLELR